MASLIWKEFVAARLLLWLVIPVGAVQLTVMASTPPLYPLAALTVAALLAFGSIALEETQRTELLWNSLPVTRGELVTARYLTVLIGMTVGLALGWAIAQVAVRPLATNAAGSAAFTGLAAHAFMFGVLAFAAAVFLPLYFRLGAGRGVVSFSAVAVGALIIASLAGHALLSAKGYPSPISDPAEWKEIWPELSARLAGWVAPRFGWLLGLFVGSSVITLLVSWGISTRVYETRDL